MLQRDFLYPTFPDVKVELWKDVPANVRAWSLSVWKDEFELRRPSMGDNDLLAWIPRIGLLAGKRGGWIGTHKSFAAVAVCFNYVSRGHRQQGWSGKMIMSLCRRATDMWGPTPFLFEIQLTIPRGLGTVDPFLSFTYTWIPFLAIQVPPKWIPMAVDEFKLLRGFHPNETTGYKSFQYNGNRVLLDPHNDIVFYDDLLALSTFDGLPIPGAYCRIFHPLGDCHVYLANLYFDTPPQFDHFMLP
jgi:hypothetical protein